MEQSTGKALPGVRLTVVVGTIETVERTTGVSGIITVDYPSPRPNRMHVNARKAGFTPMIVWIRDPAYEEEFPATFTLAMVTSCPIGGMVNDEDGRPIVGAKVSPGLVVGVGPPESRADFRIGDSLTDAEGHWICPNVPSGSVRTRLQTIRIRHPDFQSTVVSGDELTEAIGPNGHGEYSFAGSRSPAGSSIAREIRFAVRESAPVVTGSARIRQSSRRVGTAGLA